eukprot:4802099-Amphidinium_carterae.2
MGMVCCASRKGNALRKPVNNNSSLFPATESETRDCAKCCNVGIIGDTLEPHVTTGCSDYVVVAAGTGSCDMWK